MRIRSIFKIQDLQIQASTLELMNCLGNKLSCHTSVFKCWLRNKFTVFLLFLLKDCDLGHFEKLPLPPASKCSHYFSHSWFRTWSFPVSLEMIEVSFPFTRMLPSTLDKKFIRLPSNFLKVFQLWKMLWVEALLRFWCRHQTLAIQKMYCACYAGNHHKMKVEQLQGESPWLMMPCLHWKEKMSKEK